MAKIESQTKVNSKENKKKLDQIWKSMNHGKVIGLGWLMIN